MKYVVTGAAGFIGSNLVDDLLAAGHEVTGIDNFSTGHRSFLTAAADHDAFDFHELDLLRDGDIVADVIDGASAVVHLAANADVRFGWNSTRRDLQQNVEVTMNVLDAMRKTGVPRIVFSSTGSVYGETQTIPTPEDAPFPLQTSLYGASKAGAEGFISAYAEAREVNATILRFVSILGHRYTHGHVIDFMAQLRRDPGRLVVLGDGTQRKSYLEVSDCVAAIVSRLSSDVSLEVFNLGAATYCTVRDSIGWICSRLELDPEIVYSGGDRGWVGDNPFIFLDISRILATGWEPTYTLEEAVIRTVDFLHENPWLLESHDPTR